jgi:signal transduction protein with GAF and PtsI domain
MANTGIEQQQSLLGTLEAISRLVVSHTGDPSETLTNIARAIQRQFRSDVCSVYLLDADRRHLELSATIGLEPSSVGRVRMRMDEGLVGLTAEQLSPLVVADATRHPRFKYFAEANEDVYHSFLGVPMLDRGLLVGVVVVQTIDARAFTDDEVRMVTTAAGQFAPIVGDARLKHEAQLQAERLRVVQVTMRTVQDIVNNCLNQLQLLRIEAEGKVPDESLVLFDDAIRVASDKLTALGNIHEFTEHHMAVGSGLGSGHN